MTSAPTRKPWGWGNASTGIGKFLVLFSLKHSKQVHVPEAGAGDGAGRLLPQKHEDSVSGASLEHSKVTDGYS